MFKNTERKSDSLAPIGVFFVMATFLATVTDDPFCIFYLTPLSPQAARPPHLQTPPTPSAWTARRLRRPPAATETRARSRKPRMAASRCTFTRGRTNPPTRSSNRFSGLKCVSSTTSLISHKFPLSLTDVHSSSELSVRPKLST